MTESSTLAPRRERHSRETRITFIMPVRCGADPGVIRKALWRDPLGRSRATAPHIIAGQKAG
jgi:hypothetical protein